MLTPRQWEVAERVARGMSNKAIARDLGIAVRTVEWHIEDAARRVPVPDGPQRYRLLLFILLTDGDDDSAAA